jgi:hypothetical protein
MADLSKARLSVRDPGLAVVAHLFDQMQIDPEWSVRRERGFTWWGDQLAQRVWASSSEQRCGIAVWQVHIETDLVKEVGLSPDPFPVLAELNRLASLSACLLDDGHIRLHASVSVTENNLPFAKELAIHAMSLQAADAQPVAAWLSGHLGGAEDVSAHPLSGKRPTPDDMLGVAQLYKRKREEGVWTPPIDFSAVACGSNRCWLSATAGTHSFTAELPFGGDDTGAGGGADQPTARLQTWTDKPNPIFGTGVLLLLKLPGEFEARTANVDARTANILNVADTVSPDCHQLGAWCHRDDWGLAFVTFLPALVFQRGGPYATNLFESLVWHSASRALWAHSLLTA